MCFEATVQIANSAASKVEHFEARVFSESGGQRIEHGGRDQRALAGDEFA
jgi:hypothetical protein